MARERFTQIGAGSAGAKAAGLAGIADLLDTAIAPAVAPGIIVAIPPFVVVGTDVFDRFIDENGLGGQARGTDRDIAAAFERATLSAAVLADLEAWLAGVPGPLAVRSSSELEDAAALPFAGIYATRMLANNHPDPEVRSAELARAIKYVYASTRFSRVRDYLDGAGRPDLHDRMGVIVQPVVGTRGRGRFYPHVSGVARSINYYPFGPARPDDGVVELALGLGKAIVDEGVAWSWSPACPQANPPYNRPSDLLKRGQRDFWAIDLAIGAGPRAGGGDALSKFTLADADEDEALRFVASTYLPDDDRIVAGVDRDGARLVDFAPLLKADLVPLTTLVRELLARGREHVGAPVEIEFALSFDPPRPRPARFGFLQIRPMADARAPIEVPADELTGPGALVGSESALGNGVQEAIHDVVYVRPRPLEAGDARLVASEIEAFNRALVREAHPYLLVGLGRWGSTDPSAGVPVAFSQISGARVIVEAALPDTDLMLSQGSHFFHNLTTFRVLYLAVGDRQGHVDWAWLEAQPAIAETDRVRHVRLDRPLRVKVDGRTGRGVVRR